MADTNPKLTAPLRIMRDNLNERRLQLLKETREVETQIDAVDRVILISDSDHIPLNLNEGRMITIESRQPLVQLPAPPARPNTVAKVKNAVTTVEETKPTKAASKNKNTAAKKQLMSISKRSIAWR